MNPDNRPDMSVMVDNLRGAAAEAPKRTAAEIKADKIKEKSEGLKAFVNKVVEGGLGVIVHLTDKETKAAYKQEAREKHDKNVAEMKAGLKHLEDTVVGGIENGLDKFGTFVDKTVNTLITEGRKMPASLMNAVGTDIVAPVMMEVMKPAVKFADDAERTMMWKAADMLSAIGRPMANESAKLLSRFVNPVAEGAHAWNDAIQRNGNTMEGLRKISSSIDGLAARGRGAVMEVANLGLNLRMAASEIREVTITGPRHMERAATMNQLDTDAQKIRTQGLV